MELFRWGIILVILYGKVGRMIRGNVLMDKVIRDVHVLEQRKHC